MLYLHFPCVERLISKRRRIWKKLYGGLPCYRVMKESGTDTCDHEPSEGEQAKPRSARFIIYRKSSHHDKISQEAMLFVEMPSISAGARGQAVTRIEIPRFAVQHSIQGQQSPHLWCLLYKNAEGCIRDMWAGWADRQTLAAHWWCLCFRKWEITWDASVYIPAALWKQLRKSCGGINPHKSTSPILCLLDLRLPL